ncbi:MAG: FecR family protein [Myxococcota bacterium]
MTSLLLCTLYCGAPAIATSVIGDVSVDVGSQTTPLSRFDEVPEGATVRTGASARASLRLASGSMVRIGPQSQIELRQLQHSEVAGRRREGLKVVVGRVWASVLSLVGADSNFETESSRMVCGVRGTSFFVVVDESGERVILEEGALSLSVDGQTYDVDQPLSVFSAETTEILPFASEGLEALKLSTGGFAAVAPNIVDETGSASEGQRSSKAEKRLRERQEINGQDDLFDSVISVDSELLQPGAADAEVDVILIPPDDG